jgi:hypothetical protein
VSAPPDEICQHYYINLGHADARKFFKCRANLITQVQLEKYTPLPPCYATWSLKYSGYFCGWKMYSNGSVYNVKIASGTFYVPIAMIF